MVTALASAGSPTLPYISKQATPGELGGQLGMYRNRAWARIHFAPNKKARVAFRVPPGEALQGLYSEVHTTKFGVFKIRRPDNGFVRGQTVYLLFDEGEGHYAVWSHGRRGSLDLFFQTGNDGSRAYWPVWEWWLLVKDRHARKGWLCVDETAELEGLVHG